MEDLDFAQRCCKADKIAWEEFLQKYKRLIFSYINNVIRIKGYVFEPSVSEEIFNEVISSLIQNNFRKLKSYRAKNKASLATWLRHVAINSCFDYFRRMGPEMDSFDGLIGENPALSEKIAYRGLTAGEELLKKEKSESLTECIQKLTLDDKLFLELHLKWELSLEQLKDFFRVSRSVIDMRRMRIIRRLRECFKKKGFDLPE